MNDLKYTAKMIANILTGEKAPFYCRRYMVVPNIHWGLSLAHECDLLAVSSCNYAHEIEIKISASDTKADLRKHKHLVRQTIIRGLWYAMPECVYLKTTDIIPAHAGIVTIKPHSEKADKYVCKIVRKPKLNTFARPLTNDELLKLGHLASMRLWK